MTMMILCAFLAGGHEPRLSPCPSSPNCVSSDAEDAGHRISPLMVSGDARAAFSGLIDLLRSEPRTKIVEQSDDYIHVTVKTRIFRFVDDVEFELRAEEGIIAVRSASRVGHSDLGVNRRRIESIRERLRKAGVVD